MVELNERIRTLFARDIEAKIALVDVITPTIVKAGQHLVDCLLNDGKIFICGHEGTTVNSLHFSAAMLHGFEVERPSLPVINLSGEASLLSALAHNDNADQVFARQIRALGQEKDVLIVLTATGQSKHLLQLITAAHDKHIDIIALTGHDGGLVATQLNSNDIEIRIPSQQFAHIQEMHLFILHCFCDLIDRSLFGTHHH
ncbi:MAG TPA: SIS domain-containing protein [Legionellaceae bacterium]|nr:SIS domain-containing protein [Legionellaceae bacterium]